MSRLRQDKKARRNFFPRGKKERQRIELLGVAASASVALLATVIFFAGSWQQSLLGNRNVAAVVSSILVELANSDRTSNNLQALAINARLTAAAQAKANDMAAKGYFAHVAPDGKDPWYWFTQAGYSFEYAGENLAVDFSDSSDVERAWMNSPTHRENILDAHYTEIGIATAQGMYEGRLVTFVVQEFGTPAQAGARAPTYSAENIPANPSTPATASSHPASRSRAAATREVLGSSAQENAESSHFASAQQKSDASPAHAPVVVLPWWAYFVGFPREATHWAYATLSAAVVFGLAWATRFEFRKHHLPHAGAAVALVAFIGFLIIAGDLFVFTPPVLAAVGAAF